jgi:hypothetical protein
MAHKNYHRKDIKVLPHFANPIISICSTFHNAHTRNLTVKRPHETMSHDAVYYSRPRTYGKGSRNWFAYAFARTHNIKRLTSIVL